MRPSSPREKTPNTQRAFLATAVFAVLAVVIYMFCVQPAQQALVRGRAALADLQTRQDTATRDFKGAAELEARLARIRGERQRYLDALLTPLLESYAMRAKSILDPIASDAGVNVQDYAELPRRLLPLAKPPARQLYARQPIRLTCRGSYAAIASFVMRVEKMLPLVSLEAFSLKAQANNDVQSADLVFEWPILGVNTAQMAKGGAKK